jgi:hypothetical protein
MEVEEELADSEGDGLGCKQRQCEEDSGDELDDIARDDPDLKMFLDEECEEEYESGPEELFEEGEKKAKDPNYEFCPAIHRRQLLRLFTKHQCQHPFFPDRDGHHTSSEICTAAVEEMYKFCHQRHLREVWGYFWANWYSPSRWKLWARSSSPNRLSRSRTTMKVGNFWRQMKVDRLTRHRRPRLDHLTWTIVSEVLPSYMQAGARLEDTYRLGRSRELTTTQKYFKRAWRRLQKLPVSDKSYVTSVAWWTCNCGQQKYEPNHLCKHLVQAVRPPPPSFFTEIFRRRTRPLYRHPCLVDKACPSDGSYVDAGAGSITDGDDHVWLGDDSILRGGRWREFGNINDILACKRGHPDSELDHDDVPDPKRARIEDLSDHEAEVCSASDLPS